MIRRFKSHDEKTTDRAKAQDGVSEREESPPGGAGVSSPLTLPLKLPRQPYRPAQPGIPNDRSERDRLRRVARQHVEQQRLVPPLDEDELRDHAEQVCRQAGAHLICRDFAAIQVNNETWRDTLAGIPYDRRLLLLPQCLRAVDRCRASIDEFGLVCRECGSCSIHQLQTEAERLGYAVLVAEGSAVVTKMIETGAIEAVIGVSCMSVLEKCFPHMEARAVPGIAIPLLQDGCANTTVDLDWVLDAIHLTSQDKTYRLNLDVLKREVRSWFTEDSLNALLGDCEGETEAIARDWLVRAGKRWRPFLTTCVDLSLRGDVVDHSPRLPDSLKRLAVAVECFHKASLVHDDIEDGDDERYGRSALHVEYGTPVALNVGDFLLGEGYRLIGELDVDDATKVAMLRTAAAGHLALSRGQGAELCWHRRPKPLSSLEVLDIFRLKTAPAFEVALRLGASHGGADEEVHEVLTRYSEALGIAYQIRDDLEDFAGSGDSHDLRDLRPSLVLAIAHKRAADDAEAELTTALWDRTRDYAEMADEIQRLIAARGVIDTVENLLEAYTAQAARCLHTLRNPTLKGLLRRVVGKIFGDERVYGYCCEYKDRHAACRESGTGPAA
jgi:geranylgeranyl diphosphate synthase type II